MWYVIHVKTGSEAAIKTKLIEAGLPARAPVENRPIRKDGEWGYKEYVLFPGYVFVKMVFTAENYYLVKNVPGVIQFLGEPTPLSHLEDEWIRILENDGELLQPSLLRKQNDGSYQIASGVLKHFANRDINYNIRSRKAVLKFTVCSEEKDIQLGVEVIE